MEAWQSSTPCFATPLCCEYVTNYSSHSRAPHAAQTTRHAKDLQRRLIPTAARCNTLKVSIFWWWRASEGKGERKEGGRSEAEVHKQCLWGREQVTEQERERGGCLREWARERERETAVMIDARLPPLCSSEWLQQKAQNNIPDSLLCFFSLSLTLSLARSSAAYLSLPPPPFSLSLSRSLALSLRLS